MWLALFTYERSRITYLFGANNVWAWRLWRLIDWFNIRFKSIRSSRVLLRSWFGSFGRSSTSTCLAAHGLIKYRYVTLHICTEAAFTAFVHRSCLLLRFHWEALFFHIWRCFFTFIFILYFILESNSIQLWRGRVSFHRSRLANLSSWRRKARYCFSCRSRWLLGVGITHAPLQRSRILWWQRKWAHVIPSLRLCFVNLVRQIEIDNFGWQIFVNILICTHFIASFGARSVLSLHNIIFYVLTLFCVGSSFCLPIQCLMVAVFKQVTLLLLFITTLLKIWGLQTDWFCVISAQLARSRQLLRTVSVWRASHGVVSLSVNSSRFRLPQRSCIVIDGFW